MCSEAGVYNNLHTTDICVDMNDNRSYTHNSFFSKPSHVNFKRNEILRKPKKRDALIFYSLLEHAYYTVLA